MGRSRDLVLLSGVFETGPLPKEKAYLLKYFKTPLGQAFVLYTHAFDGDYSNFTDHTGLRVRPHWLRRLSDRLVELEGIHREAKLSLDLETLCAIESGEYKYDVDH